MMRTLSAIAAVFAGIGAQAYAAEPPVPKQVLSFYYGWYGNPDISGQWVHWKDVDAANKTIASSTNCPKQGAYDSHDPKVVDQHYRWAREAGLTGFIVTWWRIGDFHDKGLPLMLDSAEKHGMKVTVYYETVPPRGAPTAAGAINDILYIFDRYARHPAWLKVRGKPVIFVYGRAIGEIKLDGWKDVLREVNAKHPGGGLFIGDRLTSEAAAIFDGIHTYNPTGKTAGKAPEDIRQWARVSYPEAVAAAGHKISCLTVIPGYDDHKLGRKEPRPITARHNGRTYDVLWQEAIAANPDWVLITSWNEWHEGSEIEPSLEDGDRALKQTERYSRKFLKGNRRPSD
jgi:hypothetical protein